MYLIDSICKNSKLTQNKVYLTNFERFLPEIFVKIYLACSDPDVKRSLRLLRMTWRGCLSDSVLQEMRIRVLRQINDDINTNFSDEDRKKLIDFYKRNNLNTEELEKRKNFNGNNVRNSSPERNNNIIADGRKIKKKVKKNEEIQQPPIFRKNNENPNPNTILQLKNQIQFLNALNPIEPKKIIPTVPLQNPPINNNSNQSNTISSNSNNNNNIVNNNNQNPITISNNNNNNNQLIEKIKDIFKNFKKNNNNPLFFYILYKSFKENYEMTKQSNKKEINLNSIKTYN